MRMVSENRRIFDAEREQLIEAFKRDHDSAKLLSSTSAATDRAVLREFAAHTLPDGIALVAVVGYGSADMFPYSDLDLLVLVPPGLTEEERSPIQSFITSLWDLGLTVGATERTVTECLAAASDITVCTSLLESRFIGGSRALFDEFQCEFTMQLVPRDFFRDKMLEMHQRHARAGDSPYALEPNVKENPGGLRDLQVFMWVARASGFGKSLQDFAAPGLITTKEAAELRRAMVFLQKLRVYLHIEAHRHEDRLLFDLQAAVAADLGFKDSEAFRASEALMKSYYRNAKSVIQLSLILLQVLSEKYTGKNAAPIRPIDSEFGLRGEELDLLRRGVFDRHPEAMLRAFYLRATWPGISRESTALLRALWHTLRNPDVNLAPTDEGRKIFLDILKLDKGVYRTLRNMNTWGILDHILPPWARIDGQMQHDLFHVYTVDQHTIQVIRGLRHLVYAEHAHEFPLLSQLMAELPDTWRLIVAALFHDIGKGRGGDHSKIGEEEVREFCRSYGITPEDTEFIAFLVRDHLTMSHVAQKEDISDPAVLQRFADRVGTSDRLKALYLLTVSDIRATGPKVWNNWKGQLLERLYFHAAALLGGAAPTRSSILEMRKSTALDIAMASGLTEEDCTKLWEKLDVAYFLRHTPEDIAWHATELCRSNGEFPLVRVRMTPHRMYEVLVCADDEKGLFLKLVSALQKSSLSVLDARIHTTRDGKALDTFLAMDAGKRPEPQEVFEIASSNILDSLSGRRALPPVRLGPLSRRSKHFPIRPQVLIEPDASGTTYLLTLSCNDRLGLLYAISSVLSRFGVNLQTAKISTLGERVEDIFQISGDILADSNVCLKIAAELIETIAPAEKSAGASRITKR